MLPPDLILHRGKIITLDRSSRLAQAVSVRSGHVVAVGDDAALLKDAAPTTRRIDGKVSRRAAASPLPAFTPLPPSSTS
jgi:predicted amidohydrolase YtcJ